MPAQRTSITEHFGDLPDPRVARTKAHLLVDILTIGLCTVLCGGTGWTDMATFGQEREAWLRTFLALPNGIPSHDTFGRVFAALDPQAFGAAFVSWAQAVAPPAPGEGLAVDGKTLRRSHDRSQGRAPLHVVSAWAGERGLVLGQVAVADKSNELTAIPALLQVLDLRDCTVTIDALGCQTAIAQQIVDQGGDYLLTLKANHPTLFDEVQDSFAAIRTPTALTSTPDHTYADLGWEQAHDRLEHRQAWTITDPEVLAFVNQSGRWPKLQGLGLVEATRQVGAGARSTECRYFLLSAPLEAATFGRLVRGHWGIENQVHWVLDVVWQEDACRVRVGHAAQNLAALRHLALNLLRQDTTKRGSLTTKRFRAALDPTYLRSLLGHVHATH